MSPVDLIYNFTVQFPAIMNAFKAIVGLIGFTIFLLSLRMVLSTQRHERAEQTQAWGGLFLGCVLMAIEQWMLIWSNTIFLSSSGAVFNFDIGSKSNYEAQIIFDAAIIFTRVFGWFNLAGGTIRFHDAPKYNRPGMRRKALSLVLIGVAMGNIPIVVDIVGYSFGYEGAYDSIRSQVTSL